MPKDPRASILSSFLKIGRKSFELVAGKKAAERAKQQVLRDVQAMGETTVAEPVASRTVEGILEAARLRSQQGTIAAVGELRVGDESMMVFRQGDKFISRSKTNEIVDVTELIQTPGAQMVGKSGEGLPTRFFPSADNVDLAERRALGQLKLMLGKGVEPEDRNLARSLMLEGNLSAEDAATIAAKIRRGGKLEMDAFAEGGVNIPLREDEIALAQEILEPGELDTIRKIGAANPALARQFLLRTQIGQQEATGIQSELAQWRSRLQAPEAAGEQGGKGFTKLAGRAEGEPLVPEETLSAEIERIFQGDIDVGLNTKPFTHVSELQKLAESKGLTIVHSSADQVGVHGIVGAPEFTISGTGKRPYRANSIESARLYIENYDSTLDGFVPADKNVLAQLSKSLGEDIQAQYTARQGHIARGFGDERPVLDGIVKEALSYQADDLKVHTRWAEGLHRLKTGFLNPGDIFPREFADIFFKADRMTRAMFTEYISLRREFEKVGMGLPISTLNPTNILTGGARQKNMLKNGVLAWRIANAVPSKYFARNAAGFRGNRRAHSQDELIGVVTDIRNRAERKLATLMASGESGSVLRAQQKETQDLAIAVQALRKLNTGQFRALGKGVRFLKKLRVEEFRSKSDVLTQRRKNMFAVVRRDQGPRDVRKFFNSRDQAEAHIRNQRKVHPELQADDFAITRPGKPNIGELTEELGDTLPAYITNIQPYAYVNEYLTDKLPTMTGFDDGRMLSRLIHRGFSDFTHGEPIRGMEGKTFNKLTDFLRDTFRSHFDGIPNKQAQNQELARLINSITTALSSEGMVDEMVTRVIPRKMFVRFYMDRVPNSMPKLENFAQAMQAYIGPTMRAINYEPAVARAGEILASNSSFKGRNGQHLKRVAIDWMDYILGRYKRPRGVVARGLAALTGRGYRAGLWGNLPIAAIQATQPLLFLFPESKGVDFMAGMSMSMDKRFAQFARQWKLVVDAVPFEENSGVMAAIQNAYELGFKNPAAAARSLKDAGVTMGDFMAMSENWIRKWAVGAGISEWLRTRGLIQATGKNPRNIWTVRQDAIARLTKGQTDEMIAFAEDKLRKSMFLWSGVDRPYYLRQLEQAPVVGMFAKPLLMFSNFPLNYGNRLANWVLELGDPHTRQQSLLKLGKFFTAMTLLGGPGALEFTKLAMKEEDVEAGKTLARVFDFLEKKVSLQGYLDADISRSVGLKNIADWGGVFGRFAGATGQSNLVYRGIVDTMLASGLGEMFGEQFGISPDKVAESRGRVFGTMGPRVQDFITETLGLNMDTPRRRIQRPQGGVFGPGGSLSVPGKIFSSIPPVLIDYMRGGVMAERFWRYQAAVYANDTLQQMRGPQTQGFIGPLDEEVAIRTGRSEFRETITRGELLKDLIIGPPTSRAKEREELRDVEKRATRQRTKRSKLRQAVRNEDREELMRLVDNAPPEILVDIENIVREETRNKFFNRIERRKMDADPFFKQALLEAAQLKFSSRFSTEKEKNRAWWEMVALGQALQ